MHDGNGQICSSLLPDRYGFVTFASEKDVHNVTEMVRYFRDCFQRQQECACLASQRWS